jgi:hypothetical protein
MSESEDKEGGNGKGSETGNGCTSDCKKGIIITRTCSTS